MKCQFCELAGIDYEHDEKDMTHHPQSGDYCCQHCADTLLWRDCVFCYKKDTCTKPENDGWLGFCYEWEGEIPEGMDIV